MQSDCYRNVAAMLHAPQLCNNIKSASLDRLIGSLVAKSNCRKLDYTVGTAMPGTGPNFVGAMRLLRFGDEQLAEFLYQGRPDNYLYPILNTLRADAAFLPRLHASPSYEEPFTAENERDPHSLEFLNEMVAIQWDLPSLCQKISPNARTRNFRDYAASLQATCYSHIAFNRRDDSLCGKLPPARNFQQTNQGDFLEGCVKNVTVLRNPNMQWVHYGPRYFPTWPQFQQAAQQLGYPATTPWLQLPHPTPEEYENYLWYLAAPEHGTARADFVRRVPAIQ